MIDLHMHSTYSDGSQTPEQLILEAKTKGLRAIALTDHDTVDGIAEFVALGEQHGITTVPGVEISVDTKLPNNGHMHILGLLINPQATQLKETLNYLMKERNERAQQIINRLQALDIDITMEELLAEAGEGAIGRPHVAKILLRKGVVSSIQEAFDVYLAKGKPAYMDKKKLGEADAIRMIHEAGGLAIMAHAHLMHYDTFEETKAKLLELKELGLDGFEVYYSGMPSEFSRQLIELAEQHDFAIYGGSDYHGANKPGIEMGTGKNGDLQVPDSVLEQLLTRRQQRFA